MPSSGSKPPAAPPALRPLGAASAPRTEGVPGGKARAGERALIRRFRLVVTDGPDAGAVFAASGPRVVVGSHESADLVLDDRSVSRFHLEVTLADGQASVKDLGSRNGTLLDGVRVFHAPLSAGAVLELGRSRVRFDLGDDHVEVPLSSHHRFGLLVGGSAAMRAAFVLLERAAASEVTVLLEGETGTGKDAAAESIHHQGPRRDGPFVVVDCGAVPPGLLESELFGHERGAFTGASAARAGAFEVAHGGTIFLDEVGELDGQLQPKLLRALEKREVKPIGGNEWRPVDVRVISATNRNLRADVNTGRFRADLYYRLAVLRVVLPPLRERLDDLEPLIEDLLDQLGPQARRGAAALRKSDFREGLGRHAWPGNVRELRNYLERCLALQEPAPLEVEGALWPTPDPTQPLKRAREAVVAAFERRYLEELLRRHDGNVSAAARAAGVERPHLYRLLWRHGLR